MLQDTSAGYDYMRMDFGTITNTGSRTGDDDNSIVLEQYQAFDELPVGLRQAGRRLHRRFAGNRLACRLRHTNALTCA